MRWREFIAGIASAAAWPVVAQAQQPVKSPAPDPHRQMRTDKNNEDQCSNYHGHRTLHRPSNHLVVPSWVPNAIRQPSRDREPARRPRRAQNTCHGATPEGGAMQHLKCKPSRAPAQRQSATTMPRAATSQPTPLQAQLFECTKQSVHPLGAYSLLWRTYMTCGNGDFRKEGRRVHKDFNYFIRRVDLGLCFIGISCQSRASEALLPL
jgi:hypothetical protein